MIISLIVAMDEQRLIGVENRLPWRLPADMAWFKRQTMGKPILMGRKTYESIGRPLPGRHNIILTGQDGYQVAGATVVHTIAEGLQAAAPTAELMVIGGATLYAALLPQADRLYITYVSGDFAGDTYFPAFDRAEWRTLFQETHETDEKNLYPYQFMILERADD